MMRAREKAVDEARFIPLAFERLAPQEQLARARAFHDRMASRRSVRDFAREDVPLELVEWAIRTAGRAPSGANQQPWHFVVVSDPETKRRIRAGAEAEERENYERRFPEAWKRKLTPLGTDWEKPYLESAPHLVAVFAVTFGPPVSENPLVKHYYVQESVGIAVGFLLAALHEAGLATLTHTPSPMGFLRTILGRPSHERPFVLIPVGYPEAGCEVPDITKKRLEEIRTLHPPPASGSAPRGEAP